MREEIQKKGPKCMGYKREKTQGTGPRGQYRSQLEANNGRYLQQKGVPFEYESVYVPWTTTHKYLLDFLLLDNGVIVETKGRFVGQDRRKHLSVREQHPDLDIRFVFQNPNGRLYKGSNTTYSQWCDKYGFLWASTRIPSEWVREKPNEASLRAIEQLKRNKRNGTNE